MRRLGRIFDGCKNETPVAVASAMIIGTSRRRRRRRRRRGK